MITKDLEHLRPLTGNEPLPRDSEYLGADDLDSTVEPVLTIKHLYRGKVTLSRGKEVKNVIVFAEEKAAGIIGDVRPMIVNSTNRQMLKKLYKQVTANALEGKKIQLYIEHNVRNPSNGEMTDGIRIRDVIPKDGAKAKAAPKCSVCGKDVSGVSGLTPEQVAKMTKDKYGKQMCSTCAAKAKAEMEAKAAEAAKTDAATSAAIAEEATTAENVQDAATAATVSDLAAKLMEDDD